MKPFLACLLAGAAIASGAHAQSTPPSVAASPAGAEADDPNIWLEQVDSPRAMAWVNAENARTLGVLEKDPRYAQLYGEALTIAEAKDRIPTPHLIGGQVLNLWQDADHVRGVWRRTSVADYANPAPQWTTVLDLDALAKAENANWFWTGADCGEPAEQRCMVALSDGGEDATTQREFDLAAGRFVDGGFVLPHGKQNVAWEDDDTLLAAREWTPGELTTAGYPYVVKRLKRGQPLSSAVEVFRGSKQDTLVAPLVLHDGDGGKVVLIERALTFFENEYHLMTPKGLAAVALPAKSQPQAMVAGRLIVSLDQDWTPAGGQRFAQGSLVSLDVASMTADPQRLKPVLIYAPGPRESSAESAATRDRLVVATMENVKGRTFVYTPQVGGGWSRQRLELPDNAAISILDSDLHGDQALLSVTGFLTPSSVSLADVRSGALATVKTLPAKFDASRDAVDQYEATSKDGTRVPYFVVHPRDMRLDGSNPTILNAYGGFQVSETPFYSANIGKLWLERGGVFALANIRGGGEFGPGWHEAGLKTHRQRIYDDFSAVAQDLIARKITSTRRLGIEGGSNGGLLMGVEFTQHPELYHAVDIQVPLLDMLRFEQIAAGSSWVGEYGSVSIPQERAFLAAISPYNNLRPGVAYPEPFIWTTTKDDRVGPQHARKFAARLSRMQLPYLFYEVTEGGHGSGANLKEKARTTALEMTYFTRQLMD